LFANLDESNILPLLPSLCVEIFELLLRSQFTSHANETKDEILRLGEIDPEVDALLKELNPRPVDHSNIEQRGTSSERMNALISQLSEPDPDIKKTKIHYPTANGQRQRSGAPS
jgi:hypothetical protein